MAKLRCAVIDDYQGAAERFADWAAIADRVDVRFLHEHLEPAALADRVRDCEILVVMRERTLVGKALLERLPNLKLVVTSGMRNAAIDTAEAKRRGITVCGTSSLSEPPVELTWALILGLARHVARENAALRSGGPWQSTVGVDLKGSRLGLLGLGKIGSRVAKVALAFEMPVVAWSQNLDAARCAAAGVELAPSKEALLETSDFVSIHLVLGDRTRGLIGAAELRRMRPTAFLINTSRSAIVDTVALQTALRERWIAGAGVDVFDTEPLPPGDAWRGIANLLATPHLGYVTANNYRAYFTQGVEAIAAFLAGHPVRVIGA
jgi:phosphoglycerate dehydrogenase-like enzyme